jgi:hypothetical protein
MITKWTCRKIAQKVANRFKTETMININDDALRLSDTLKLESHMYFGHMQIDQTSAIFIFALRRRCVLIN